MQEGIDQSAEPAEVAGALNWGRVSWIYLGAAVVCGMFIVAGRWMRMKAAPRRPKFFTPEVGLTLLFGMFLLGSLGSLAVTRLLDLEAGVTDFATKSKLLLGAYAGQAIIVGVYMGRLRRRKRPMHEERPSRGRAFWIGLFALAILWPIVMTTGNVIGLVGELVWNRPAEAIGHDLLGQFLTEPRDVWFWVMIPLVTILPGVMEEVMYRGLGQELLRRLPLSRWTAITITSVVFALIHVGVAAPHALAALFVLSLGFGWAYEKTGRLTTPIVMHISFNVANLALTMWYYN